MIALCVPVVLLILFKIWVYNKSLKKFRLRWARFCFAVSLVADCLIPAGIFVAPAPFLMVCMVFSFLLFWGCRSLVFEMVAGNTDPAVADYSGTDFVELEKALEQWIASKSFRDQNSTRDGIAEELHVTKEELNSYFAEKIGVDFRTWRTALRIEDAKTLLLENQDSPISIIAEACGFSDKSNFHRQFVKLVGCSPKEWRDSGGKVS